MIGEGDAGGQDLRYRAREAYRQRAWADAYEMLATADRHTCALAHRSDDPQNSGGSIGGVRTDPGAVEVPGGRV